MHEDDFKAASKSLEMVYAMLGDASVENATYFYRFDRLSLPIPN